MIIRGKLVKIDMGEMQGKPYGDIHISDKSGNIVLKYPLGAEFQLPVIGSIVEAEFSGESIRTLEKITLISLPEKINTKIPFTPEKEKPPARYPDAFWNKSFMGLGISTSPLDWIIMIGLVSMGLIIYSLGDTMTGWYFSPESWNSIRDTFVSLSYDAAVVALVCGIFVGTTKEKNLSTTSSFFAMVSGAITALYWTSLLSSNLLVTSEESFAMVYFYVCILIAFLSFVRMLKTRSS